jgi:hypothetical protein
MPRLKIPLPLGFYTSQSLPFSAQRCINWIPTVAQGPAQNKAALMQRPGIKSFADTSNGICRGGQDFAGTPFFVNGTTLNSISSAGVSTSHGTITGISRVSMANNGSQMVIVVPGGDAFVYNGSTVTKITDPDFQVSDSVVFYRGYFVFTTSDGKQLFVSNLNQPLVFDALDFGSAEGDPDRIVTQILDHDELSIIGERTTETFRQVGGSGFPLQIIQGAYTEKGAASKYGAVKFDSTYMFIGGGVNEQSSIWRQTSSASASKVSTDAIDYEIQKFTKAEIAQAFAMTYSANGQIFAVFSFKSNRIPGKTFVYNGTASALGGGLVWFELQSGVTDSAWRVNTIIKAYGKILLGDDVDGRIGVLDGATFTDYGSPLFRQATTSPFNQDGLPIFAGEFEATFESGTGLNTGQGSDPQVRMDFSDDGARTWSNEFSRSIGKIGAYEQRSIWRRQGRFPVARVIRLTVTDPVMSNLIKMTSTPSLGIK